MCGRDTLSRRQNEGKHRTHNFASVHGKEEEVSAVTRRRIHYLKWFYVY